MYTHIISTQQILITAAFLGVMILFLVILRKSTVIRANMRAGKRINILEDTAVSPSERLRLVSVDSTNFIMLSAKGHAPSLVRLKVFEAEPNTQRILDGNMDGETDEMKAALAKAMEAHANSKPFERKSVRPSLAADGASEVQQNEKQRVFAEEFRSWRQPNDAR